MVRYGMWGSAMQGHPTTLFPNLPKTRDNRYSMHPKRAIQERHWKQQGAVQARQKSSYEATTPDRQYRHRTGPAEYPSATCQAYLGHVATGDRLPHALQAQRRADGGVEGAHAVDDGVRPRYVLCTSAGGSEAVRGAPRLRRSESSVSLMSNQQCWSSRPQAITPASQHRRIIPQDP